MYYRRKIILAILQQFDGQMDKIRLQKLLFLFTRRQAKKEYDFVPYRYGCYSFSASADIAAMARQGSVKEDGANLASLEKTDYIHQLKPFDRQILREIHTSYGNMSTPALTRHTYLVYPFYAIHSEVAASMLDTQEMHEVKLARPERTDTVLFTIGYEGISLEEYLVRLLKNDVNVLVDVRNNPLSMKFGFSKSQLKKYCASLGIEYMHIPEVGIQSDQRQKLVTQADYDRLFTIYRKVSLPQTTDSQLQILALLNQYKRIALTCFEANICQCHRKHLAEAIEKLPGFQYEVKHI